MCFSKFSIFQKFLTPRETLDMHEKSLLKLMPPQIYEMERMLKFTNFKQLSKYSLDRQLRHGLQPWLPKFTSDFGIGLLPGKIKEIEKIS